MSACAGIWCRETWREGRGTSGRRALARGRGLPVPEEGMATRTVRGWRSGSGIRSGGGYDCGDWYRGMPRKTFGAYGKPGYCGQTAKGQLVGLHPT